MASVKTVRRLASNPRRKRRSASRLRKANAHRRVKRAANGRFVKRRRVTKRRAAVRAAVNPPARRRRRRTTPKVVRRRKSNPTPVLISLGALNPHKGAKKVAKTRKRRRNAAAQVTRRRRRTVRRMASNPIRHHRRRRVMNYRRRAVNRRGRRRNPDLSASNLSASAKLGLGVLLGVAATRFVLGFVPASLVGTPIMRVVATGAAAFLVGGASKRFASSLHGGVVAGGMALTASAALNAFLPSVGAQIGLRGMGEFVPASFPVPQNPVLAGIPAPAPSPRVTMSGMSRAFGSSAF